VTGQAVAAEDRQDFLLEIDLVIAFDFGDFDRRRSCRQAACDDNKNCDNKTANHHSELRTEY